MFEYRDGILYCEDVPVPEIARKYGTPVYVYSRKEIERRISKLKSVFGDAPHLIAYSFKANNNPILLRIIKDAGLGADTVSVGEVNLALDLGFEPEKMVFAGVGKRRDELEFAIEKGIKSINVESYEELLLIDEIAKAHSRPVSVALRVNPDVAPKTIDKISTAKKTSKFGIDMETARHIFSNFKSRFVQIRGLHVHIGSQIFEYEPYLEAVEKVAPLVNGKLQFFDVGGGFGVDYEGDGREFDFEGFKKYVVPRILELADEVITEPGRFIIAKSSILVTEVLYRKPHFIIVDAGMNDFSRPAYYGARHRIVNVTLKGMEKEVVGVGGPVCESTDVFGKDFELEIPERGELLAIMDTGAYGMSMASNYNARPRPAEVLCEGKSFTLIRHRELLDDVLWRGVPE